MMNFYVYTTYIKQEKFTAHFSRPPGVTAFFFVNITISGLIFMKIHDHACCGRPWNGKAIPF
jgi:hypothetical protein